MEKDHFLGVIIKHQTPDSDRPGPVKAVLSRPDGKKSPDLSKWPSTEGGCREVPVKVGTTHSRMD